MAAVAALARGMKVFGAGNKPTVISSGQEGGRAPALRPKTFHTGQETQRCHPRHVWATRLPFSVAVPVPELRG